MNQIEFLLRLSENAQETGDEIAQRHNLERSSHIKALLELDRMVDLAKDNIQNELKRWGVPQQKAIQEPMPKVVTRGPANEPLQRQDDGRGPANNQVHRQS